MDSAYTQNPSFVNPHGLTDKERELAIEMAEARMLSAHDAGKYLDAEHWQRVMFHLIRNRSAGQVERMEANL